MTKKQFPIRLNLKTKTTLEKTARKTGYSMQKIAEIAIESLLFGEYDEQVVFIKKLANQND